jgi:two-component system chemotaxis response regulator CheB
MEGKVIVVGASAGGMEAFLRLASELSPETPAAICLVLHISAQAPAPTGFAKKISNQSPFRAVFAEEGAAVEDGFNLPCPA